MPSKKPFTVPYHWRLPPVTPDGDIPPDIDGQPMSQRRKRKWRNRQVGVYHLAQMLARSYLHCLDIEGAARMVGMRASTAALWIEGRGSGGCVVAPLVKRELQRRVDRLDITGNRVLQELAAVAFANPADLLEWGPEGVTVRKSSEMDEADQRAVAEVAEARTKDGTLLLKIKMHDKLAALQKLGEYTKVLRKQSDGGERDFVLNIYSNGQGQALPKDITPKPEQVEGPEVQLNILPAVRAPRKPGG